MTSEIGAATFVKIIDAIKIRESLYAFLSRGFKREVDEAFLGDLQTMLPIFGKLAADLKFEELARLIEVFREFVDRFPDQAIMIRDLERKFATLFLSAGGGGMVKSIYPFESVYLSPEGQTMQKQRDEVSEFYSRYGMGVSDNFKEPEDHLSVELSFISRLCGLIINGLSIVNIKKVLGILKDQKVFMRDHLLKWVIFCKEDLKEADQDGFYHYLAEMTIAYLEIDRRFLNNLIEIVEEIGTR